MLIFIIGLAFAATSPIILPFTLIYFIQVGLQAGCILSGHSLQLCSNSPMRATASMISSRKTLFNFDQL